MNREIYDHKLQSYLKGVIKKLPYSQQMQLKSVQLCNVNAIRQPGATSGIHLMRSKAAHSAKIVGQNTCKSPWICPCCTARQMSEYAKKIAATIDAMKQKGYIGFMMTFTVAHLKFQSCREVTDILYNTWKYCFCNLKKTKRTHGSREFQNFYDTFKIKHRVRVCEYTWGKRNGWHPHFHCIFWVEKKYADQILEWEERLNAYWDKYAQIYTQKYWEKNNLYAEDREKKLSAIQLCYNYQADQKLQGVHISRTKEGKLLQAESSEYICGWGSDRELTGNVRKEASHSNHYTPYQILELASKGDTEMENLYIEFMLQVTRKPVHHRVDFSQSGLHKIRIDYMNTAGYQSVLASKKKPPTDWETIGFFLPEQWLQICHLDQSFPLISNILYLAANCYDDILHEHLKFYNIKMLNPELSNVSKHLENIFNKTIAA